MKILCFTLLICQNNTSFCYILWDLSLLQPRRLWSCDNFLKMFKHGDYNGALLYLFGSATSLLANHLDGKKSFYAQNKFYKFFGLVVNHPLFTHSPFLPDNF